MRHKTTNINVLVSDDFNKVINDVAGKRRTTKSDLMRTMALDYFQRNYQNVLNEKMKVSYLL